MRESDVGFRLIVHAVLCAALSLPLAGCSKKGEPETPVKSEQVNIWKDKYEDLAKESEKAYQRVADLEKLNASLQQQVESLKAERDKALAQKTPPEQLQEMQKRLADREATITQLNARVAELKEQAEKAQRLANATEAAKELSAVTNTIRTARPRLEAVGKDACDSGYYSAAREVLTGAVELGSGSPAVLFELGFSCAELGDNAAAADWYAKAAEAARKDKDAAGLLAKICSNHGAALVALGKPGEALKAYEKSIQADEKYAPVYFNLGRLYAEQMKDSAKAVEAYRRHVALGGSRSTAALEAIKKLQGEQAAVPAAGAK